jgi:putative MATE family efflux protein
MMADSKKLSRERLMGSAPMLPLIIKMSLPSMFSMLIQALYNIVDSIFVSRLGEYALSAVSLIFPIQMLNVAVGVGTGIGLASLISRKLGEQNYEHANISASHGVFLAVCSWVVFVIVGLFGVPAFVGAFSKTSEVTAAAAVSYGQIVCIGSLFVFNAMAVERVMQACGDMIAPMFCSLTGCITNVILDPIMIFGKLGCPAFGVAGAAYATVIGQVANFTVAMLFLRSRKLPVKIDMRGFRPRKTAIAQIYQVALPSMMIQSIGSVTNIALNAILIGFSESAMAALGIYFKLQSFVFMPVFGMNQGVMPIMGYNFGARNRARLMDCFKKAVVIAFIIMSVGTLIFQVFPAELMRLFDAEGDLLAIGVKALRTISYSFPLAAVSIICGTMFQGTGHGVNSMIVAVLRQLVVIVPAAFLLSKAFGVMGVWYAYPLAEIMGITVSLLLFRKLYDKEIKTMQSVV